jgi:hypothetical protein
MTVTVYLVFSFFNIYIKSKLKSIKQIEKRYLPRYTGDAFSLKLVVVVVA